MWNKFATHTSYDPFSTPMGYGFPEDVDIPDDHLHRTVEPIQNPGKSRLSLLRKEAQREDQRMPFVEDACSVCLDSEYTTAHVLRDDMSLEEETTIRQRSWSTCTKAALVTLVVMLTTCGLLGLAVEGDIFAYSKLFRVPKGANHWRIIADSRIAGRLCRPPPPVNFVEIRTLLTEIALLGATFAVVGDFKFWFYQHAVNPVLQRMFGIACGSMYRVMKCLPMGWPHSPRYAQCIAWGVILHRKPGEDPLGVYETWGNDPPPFVRLRTEPGGPTVGLIFLWLDNVMVIHKDSKERDKWFVRLTRNAGVFPEGVTDGDVGPDGELIQRDGFNVRWKNLDKTDRPCYLGISFKTTSAGVVWSHEKDRILKWKILVKAPIVTPRDAARLVGITIWHQTVTMEPMFDVKASIDVMKAVAPFVTCKSHWDVPLEKLGFTLTPKHESLLRDPVFLALKNPQCGIALQSVKHTLYAACDACQEDQSEPMRKDGRSVMKRPHLIDNGAGAILFGGSVDEFQYLSHRWTDAERLLDIHILELMGVRETVKWIRPQAQLTRLILGCDNTVAVSVLTKCYSSCSLCCDLAREILRICAEKNIHLQIMWIPGPENAADPPSRGASPDPILNLRSWEILHGSPPHTARIGRRSSVAVTSKIPDHRSDWEAENHAEDFEMAMKRLFTH